MNRKTARIVAIAMTLSGASLGLGGCGAIQDSQIFQPDFWTISGGGGPVENDLAELGLAELSKGNNVQAQGHFQAALKANPNDVYALYGLAVMYQNTGQPSRARQLYEQILTLDPQPVEEILIWADKQTQPITDIAQVNMVRLENGQPAAMPGAPMPGQAMGQSMTGQSMGQPGAAPQAMPQSQLYVQPGGAVGQPQAMAPQGQMSGGGQDQPMFQDADLNIVKRFDALRALLDQGLITQEEFVQRRTANVGALLPQTSKPPATGLDRPVPSVEQISGRLRAISRALEMRALSPAQHMAERSMILDALMPAKPASVQNPPPPPKGLMEAADAVRRLEMLKNRDLITSDEYAKERAAIERSMQPSPGTQPAGGDMASQSGSGGAQAQNLSASSSQPKLSGFQPGVHLASYRREADAQKGWAELQRKFGQLSTLSPHIERVNLGGSKGVFFRLKAGPLPSNGAAQDLCRQLKAKRQYCEPTTVNLG